jgi:8-oxo-dGTP pyrophosphatase MutT (NUDIX family)
MAAEPIPSATVVLARDAGESLEVLLLKRSPRRDGDSLPWVFPGGKVDATDRHESGAEPAAHALRAAIRETREEAGLEIQGDRLVAISRWITPDVAPRRFDTWFFLGAIDRELAVQVDGNEICDHRWLSPTNALAAHHANEMRLAPPTFVTVAWLEGFDRAGEAVRVLGRRPLRIYRPNIRRIPGGACVLYPGDAGYGDGDIERPGPRNRLWSLKDGYRYEASE